LQRKKIRAGFDMLDRTIPLLVSRAEGRTLIENENRVSRRIFGSERTEITGGWRKLHIKSFIICTPCQILLEWSNHEG
jgi:hypothetical protein